VYKKVIKEYKKIGESHVYDFFTKVEEFKDKLMIMQKEGNEEFREVIDEVIEFYVDVFEEEHYTLNSLSSHYKDLGDFLESEQASYERFNNKSKKESNEYELG